MTAVEVAVEVAQDLVAAIQLLILRYQAFSVGDMLRAAVAKKKTINIASHIVMVCALYLQVSSELDLDVAHVLVSEP